MLPPRWLAQYGSWGTGIRTHSYYIVPLLHDIGSNGSFRHGEAPHGTIGSYCYASIQNFSTQKSPASYLVSTWNSSLSIDCCHLTKLIVLSSHNRCPKLARYRLGKLMICSRSQPAASFDLPL